LEQVAELTGFSVRTIADGCRAGQIPHTRFRSTRVMTLDQIAQFLAAHEVRPAVAEVPAEGDRVAQWRARVARQVTRPNARAVA
jgi:hypothetical protein